MEIVGGWQLEKNAEGFSDMAALNIDPFPELNDPARLCPQAQLLADVTRFTFPDSNNPLSNSG
jgi:hypothetical protein